VNKFTHLTRYTFAYYVTRLSVGCGLLMPLKCDDAENPLYSPCNHSLSY